MPDILWKEISCRSSSRVIDMIEERTELGDSAVESNALAPKQKRPQADTAVLSIEGL